MAGVTALRDAARNALLSAGGRGFVRFAPEGSALLVSDANRRCEGREEAGRLITALRASGFSAWIADGLINIAPDDRLLEALCDAQPESIELSDGELFETAAFAGRLIKNARLPLTGEGRRLTIETARLLWKPKTQMIDGMTALRAQVAAMLRTGERSGMHQAGRLLCGWLKEQIQ